MRENGIMNLSAGWKLTLQLAGLGCIVASLFLFFTVRVSADLRSSSERNIEAALFYRQPDRQFNERNKIRVFAAFPENGEPARILFIFHSLRPISQFRLDPGDKPGASYRLDALSIRFYGGLLEYRADTPDAAARIEVNEQIVPDREKLPCISMTTTGTDPQILITTASLSRRLNLSGGSLLCPGLFLLGTVLLLTPGFLSRRSEKRQQESAGGPA